MELKEIVFGFVLFIFVLALVFVSWRGTDSSDTGLAGLRFAGTYSSTRSFSASTIDQNQLLLVTVTLNFTDGNFYGVEEKIPSGFTVVDANGADYNSINSKLYWINLTAPPKTYIHRYTLRAVTSGTKVFDGNTGFDDGSGTTSYTISTGGSTTVTVNAVPCLGQPDLASCGANRYCCGQTCVTSACDSNCQTPSSCTGTTLNCSTKSGYETIPCGLLLCPSSTCYGAGNNTLRAYPVSCNKFCLATGTCGSCICADTNIVCGTSSYCVAGLSACTNCDSNHLNCDTLSSNGCEINKMTDVNNCGSCGVAVASGEVCVGGYPKKAICNADPRRFTLGQVMTVQVPLWVSGRINLEEMLTIVKLYKYCQGV